MYSYPNLYEKIQYKMKNDTSFIVKLFFKIGMLNNV